MRVSHSIHSPHLQGAGPHKTAPKGDASSRGTVGDPSSLGERGVAFFTRKLAETRESAFDLNVFQANVQNGTYLSSEAAGRTAAALLNR